MSRVDYDLRLTGETITGQARLTIDVLKQGWVSVQVPAGMLIRDARLDGSPTAIVDGDPPRILIARGGRSTLNLGVVVPLVSSAGTESMTLPGPGCALSAVTLTIPGKAGEEGKLFGSVTAQDVAEALGRAGHQVDRRRIELDHPIKSLGDHLVSVRLHPEVRAEVRVSVVPE